jgi:Short C-terminal domain/Phospholipase_D-nuclease N-terminal
MIFGSREEPTVLVSTTWGTGQVLLDMVWLVLLVIEIWLMFTIFIDIFRQHEMPGWLKAFWVLLVIIFPLIGILLYLIIYGNKMRVHAQQYAAANEAQLEEYIRRVAGTHNPSEELNRLADLRDRGVINDEEFSRLKSRVVDGGGR